jgi:hypothetical protein
MDLSPKPFGIGYMYIDTFLLRMTDTKTSHNTDLSSWDILCMSIISHSVARRYNTMTYRLKAGIWDARIVP